MIDKKIIEKAEEYALKEIEEYGLPALINFETSKEKGQKIAKTLGADKDIVMIGTILMDLKLGRAKKENKIKEHVKMSVDAAKEFLGQFDIKDETKEKIINCVEAHHGNRGYICKEAEICANADCYRFLFPKNVFAFIADNMKDGMSLKEALDFANEKMEEKHKILSLDIVKKELEPSYQKFKALLDKARE